MSQAKLIVIQSAKTGGEEPFVKNAKRCGGMSGERSELHVKIINLVKSMWPKKTSAYLSHLTGRSERAVQFWLAGETRMSMEDMAALLKTDQGFEVLRAIMGNVKLEWWIVAQSAHDIRATRKIIKAQEDRIAATRAQLTLLDQ